MRTITIASDDFGTVVSLMATGELAELTDYHSYLSYLRLQPQLKERLEQQGLEASVIPGQFDTMAIGMTIEDGGQSRKIRARLDIFEIRDFRPVYDCSLLAGGQIYQEAREGLCCRPHHLRLDTEEGDREVKVLSLKIAAACQVELPFRTKVVPPSVGRNLLERAVVLDS